jgi:hypothetical protein
MNMCNNELRYEYAIIKDMNNNDMNNNAHE